MSAITTHVLDTSKGQPAGGITATLTIQSSDGNFQRLAQGTTNNDGRIADLLEKDKAIEKGIYCLTFDTASYFSNAQMESFYPCVKIFFEVTDPAQHYHVPLLLNPFGYSTYRGS